MLEADLRDAIEDASMLGDFFVLMEHKGYEIKYGNRLSFRLRRQERYMCPGRKNPLFTEDGILAAIQGNMEAVEAGLKSLFGFRKQGDKGRLWRQRCRECKQLNMADRKNCYAFSRAF